MASHFLVPANEKIKLRKSLQESQNKLAALQLDAELSQRYWMLFCLLQSFV